MLVVFCLVKELETIALSISGKMAKKTVSVPVVHKEIGKEKEKPKRGIKILTKFRQENVSGLEKVDRIIPTVKNIISIKENCKAATENVLDRLNQQDIYKENIHLLLEKRIIEHCQCKRDHLEQELFKIGITEKLYDCLSLFEDVLQMLGLEYCKDGSSSVEIVLPRLLENFENLLRHHKNVDLLTTHEDVLKKDVDELNEKIKIQEKNNAKLRFAVHMLRTGVLEFGRALKNNQKTEEETTDECTLDDEKLFAKLRNLESINSKLIEKVKLTENAVKMAMMFHGNNGDLNFDYQTEEEEEENVALDQAVKNLCTTTFEFLSYGANQITQMAKVKQHEMEQLDLIKEKIKKHMVKKEKEAVKNSNFIVNKYYARKHELQLQIDQLQNEDNRLIASIIKNPEGVFSKIYGNNYKFKYNNQAHSSLMVLLETLVKNRSNMAVILRKIFTNERSHPSFSDFYYEEKINEAELLLDKLCYKADMLYAESIQLDKNIAEIEEEIKKSKSKMEELQNGVDYYEKDVQKENSLKSQLLLAKETQKIMDAKIELVNGELCNLERARRMQRERLKYKKRHLKKLYRDFLTMKNSNKGEGKVEFCEDISIESYGAYGRGEHHRLEEISTLFNQLQSAINENLKVKEIEYSTHKILDKLKYELDKELDEIRKKRMKILHLECQYKIKQTADVVVDEKDLSNSDMDHHTSPSQRKKLSLSCISEMMMDDEIQTLKSEEKKTGELLMCFSGIKQVNEILTLLNEMEECSKGFQQLAESEKESAHHVSNDFISISEEIPNGSSFFTDVELESGRKFQNEKTEESISKTSAHAETTAQSFSEKSHSSKTGKHESDSENPRNNGGSMLSATAVVAMLEIAVQQREPVVFYHHMKGQKPSFLEITTLSNFILQQKNSFYNTL
ncbi:hypothetical protein T12_9548 [Trichinella patagoniensis]|uniref:Uncharacterized protein n=1 Tax=Trichinella patagoniensis TaxID=990121 RepID=A0A0V0ZA80_9BILA|nr:hypothetical protein T12_9548 [Trichinella patagoniensis]